MQENNNDELLKKELQKKLDWYTMYATEEEYNQEDVDHILSLLASLDPLEEGEIPPVEQSWERLCQKCENPRELLPLDDEVLARIGAAAVSKAEDRVSGDREVSASKEKGDSVSGKADALVSGKNGEPDTNGSGAADADKNHPGSHENPSAPNKGKGKIIEFVLRHKAIVAAVFLVMVLAVGGSIQAGAIKNSGFFMWLKHDETGMQMVTSPDAMDVESNAVKTSNYSDRNDMPEWTQDWLKIEAEFELPSDYEWKCFQITEIDYMRNIMSCYFDKDSNQDMILGIYIYIENILYNRDGFADYELIDRYEIEYGELEVYCKTEETGELSYVICFYEGNCKYYVSMQDDLEEVKRLTEQYWSCVKKYL